MLADNFHVLGVLSCLDGYMNIALEQTEEHVNGTVTNRYGDAFIRGNNGAFISSDLYFYKHPSSNSFLFVLLSEVRRRETDYWFQYYTSRLRKSYDAS